MGRRPRDLSGQKFGLLTAVYPTERRDHRGSVYWHCVCECGNEIDVAAGALLDGNNRSCGCLKDKNQKQIAQRRHFVDGTCVEVLEKRKKRRDNESGFRGVFYLRTATVTVWISDSKGRGIMSDSLKIMTKQFRRVWKQKI